MVDRDVGWRGEEDGLWDAEVELEKSDDRDDGLRFASSGRLHEGETDQTQAEKGRKRADSRLGSGLAARPSPSLQPWSD